METDEVRTCDYCGQELPPLEVEEHPILGPPYPYAAEFLAWFKGLEPTETPFLQRLNEAGPLGSDPSSLSSPESFVQNVTQRRQRPARVLAGGDGHRTQTPSPGVANPEPDRCHEKS